MKIPVNSLYKGRLIPNLLITIFGSRAPTSIIAIIDTGSEKTILSYKDALLLQMPVKNMTITDRITGITGDSVGLCEYRRNISLFMKKEDETSFKIELGKISISTNSNGANISIIGMDLLKENNLKFFYNPNGESYLEKNN